MPTGSTNAPRACSSPGSARSDAPISPRHSNAMSIANALLERNLLPDPVIRMGIRGLLRARLRQERIPSEELQQERFAEVVAAMDRSPIAIDTAAANTQHYEVPTAFFQRVLGKHLKYSSGYWRPGVNDLD